GPGKFRKGAGKEAAIYDIKVQDPAMIRLLDERARKGVKIRIIGSLKGSIQGVAVYPLTGFRPPPRRFIRAGRRAFAGSQRRRCLQLGERRELGLLVSNPSGTRQLLHVFEADW